MNLKKYCTRSIAAALRGGGQPFITSSLSSAPSQCLFTARTAAARIAERTTDRSSVPIGSGSSSSSNDFGGILNIVSILPSPSRIMFATLVSFALSEAFNYLGLFQDENGLRAKAEADHFFQKHKQNNNNEVESMLSSLAIGILDWIDVNVREEGGLLHLPTILGKVEHFVEEVRSSSNGSNTNTVQWQWRRWKHRIQNMAFKHQFAIGTTMGIILYGGSVLISKVALITYMLSEVSHNILSNYDEKARSAQSKKYDDDDINSNSYFPYGITFDNGGNERGYNRENNYNYDDGNMDSFIDAEILFDHLKDIRIIIFRCLKYANKKLNWFRLGVRSILSSSGKKSSSSSKKNFFDNVGVWIDGEDSGEGTIIVGFVFGVFLGYLLS